MRGSILAAALALAASRARAQPAPAPPDSPAARFHQLASEEREQLRRSTFQREHEHRTERSNAEPRNVTVDTPAVDPASGFTAAERAAAVVSTSVDGARAGVNVSPFLFSPHPGLRGFSFTAAAFDGGTTRVGAGYRLERRRAPRFDDLGLRCQLDDNDFQRALEAPGAAFVQVCDHLRRLDRSALACDLPTTAEIKRCQIEVNSGMAACGLDQPFPDPKDPPRTVTAAVASLTALLAHVRDAGATELALYIPGKVLRDFRPPRPLDCITDAQIDAAVTRWVWDHARHRLSIAGFWDLFPLTFGHDPEMRKQLETRQREGRVDWAYARRRLELGAGAAVSTGREDRGKPLATTVRPTAWIAYVAGALDGEPLERDGAVRTTSQGHLPPIVTVGARLELGLATAPPDTDPAALRDLTLTLDLDFRYSEELAFRLGVPLAMKRVAAMADPTDAGPQWTVPVFVATVLAL